MLSSHTRFAASPHTLPDPLDEDVSGEVSHVTTERRLVRLVTLASDVGARFEREKLPYDPVAWMMAPRVLFGGARALEAAQTRDGFLHATLLHGLGLGLDARRGDLEALLEDDDETGTDVVEAEGRDESEATPPPVADGAAAGNVVTGAFGQARRQLYCCSIVDHGGPVCIQAFCATVAPDEGTARRRIVERFGRGLEHVEVRAGFDPSDPLACSLVSDATAAMLELVAADPSGPLGDGLDLLLEQRFAA